MGKRSGFAGGELACDAFKNSLSFLVITHGIQFGAKAEQCLHRKRVAGMLGGEFLECIHCGGLLILIP